MLPRWLHRHNKTSDFTTISPFLNSFNTLKNLIRYRKIRYLFSHEEPLLRSCPRWLHSITKTVTLKLHNTRNNNNRKKESNLHVKYSIAVDHTRSANIWNRKVSWLKTRFNSLVKIVHLTITFKQTAWPSQNPNHSTLRKLIPKHIKDINLLNRSVA